VIFNGLIIAPILVLFVLAVVTATKYFGGIAQRRSVRRASITADAQRFRRDYAHTLDGYEPPDERVIRWDWPIQSGARLGL
jgi:hypothetical protein